MTVDQILEALRSQPWVDAVGVRRLHDDETPAVGDILRRSYAWEDGDMTDEELPGTCAFNIRRVNRQSIEDAMQLASAYEIGSSPRFALIVGSGSASYDGLEDGATIIRDAEVIAVW